MGAQRRAEAHDHSKSPCAYPSVEGLDVMALTNDNGRHFRVVHKTVTVKEVERERLAGGLVDVPIDTRSRL